MTVNNESYGIAAEVAIAKSFNVKINECYVSRAEKETVELLLNNNNIKNIFLIENIPHPIRHIAENLNPIDFILVGEKSLSVKTNIGKLGKVSPQNIGQPTCNTYFDYLEKYFKEKYTSNFSLENYLRDNNLRNDYNGKSIAFKQISIDFIDDVISMYWNNLFDCDYYLHFYNLKNRSDPIKNYICFKKSNPPIWNKELFTFTQSLFTWNESNTVKYSDVSIGEFQVHKNRNCFKFRFNVDGIRKLISSQEITIL